MNVVSIQVIKEDDAVSQAALDVNNYDSPEQEAFLLISERIFTGEIVWVTRPLANKYKRFIEKLNSRAYQVINYGGCPVTEFDVLVDAGIY